VQFPIVFTDLDGTLLDHYTYSFSAALPTLSMLKQADIPVIATTSKTVQEVTNLYESLELSSPFIVENGAAIYIPKRFFPKQPEDTTVQGEFWLKTFSQPRSIYIKIIEQLCSDFGELFESFSQMSYERIAEVTGLSLAAAKEANQRQYGEPVLWHGDNAQKLSFIEAAKSLGANVLQGGRFIHICDDCDKGKALNWLAGEYQHQFKLPTVTAIALGDSGNDSAMLEAADIAVQIKSPTHSYPSIDESKVAFIYQTLGFGPVGWTEALTEILELPSSSILKKPNGGYSHG
tara:strand:- start:83 stop:952 length:870 start_codon:yes stop_codon:yes gene_type:complete